jgi:hypothetical protein
MNAVKILTLIGSTMPDEAVKNGVTNLQRSGTSVITFKLLEGCIVMNEKTDELKPLSTYDFDIIVIDPPNIPWYVMNEFADWFKSRNIQKGELLLTNYSHEWTREEGFDGFDGYDGNAENILEKISSFVKQNN